MPHWYRRRWPAPAHPSPTACSILPAERRRAMYALYGFCRAVDDIADAPAPIDEKRIGTRRLGRVELDRIYAGQADISALGPRTDRRCAAAIDLPRDGIRSGARRHDDRRRAGRADRRPGCACQHYARRVSPALSASCPAASSVRTGSGDQGFRRIFGRDLCRLTNILRDVDEDAAIDRLYTCRSTCSAGVGIPDRSERRWPSPPIHAPRRHVCETSGCRGEWSAIAPAARPASFVKYRKEMRSALIMQKAYGLIFDKLLARGWRGRGWQRPRLTKREGLGHGTVQPSAQ